MEEEKKKLMEAGDEDAAKALEEKFAQDSAPVEVNFDDLDVFAVEDVMDLGNTMPLFAQFLYEDWALLNLRAELHLLLHNFKKDLDDADRPSFVEAHLGYYYQKYFKKSWNFNQYGLAKFADLLDILKDAISVDSTSNFLQAPLVGLRLELSRGNSDRGCAIRGCHARDLPEVYRGTRKLQQCDGVPSCLPSACSAYSRSSQDHRRERERRVDAGDETAKLKFSRPAVGVPALPSIYSCGTEGQHRRQHGKRRLPHETKTTQCSQSRTVACELSTQDKGGGKGSASGGGGKGDVWVNRLGLPFQV